MVDEYGIPTYVAGEHYPSRKAFCEAYGKRQSAHRAHERRGMSLDEIAAKWAAQQPTSVGTTEEVRNNK